MELGHLVGICVLAPQQESDWASPSFITPKKDDRVVGRRGTNQLHLVEWYLDVLVKHTTEIPPPTALVEVRPQLP